MNFHRIPLLGLRAFEATARHLSVSNAATELCVTPGAVSQQVKLLEEFVGVPLLRRKGRSVELTDAGEVLRPALTRAFQTIQLTLEAVVRTPRLDTLKLCLLPTLAERWLVPRLSGFHDANTHLQIQIMTSFRDVRFDSEDVDIASFMGSELPAGLEGLRLFDYTFLPVCNPSFLRDPWNLETATDLARMTLLRSVRRMNDWERWLTAAGVEGLKPQRNLSFENTSLAIQAAIDGLGIAVVQPEYVRELLGTGALVAPFDLVGHGDAGYYLAWSTTRRKSLAFDSFVQWVRQEIGKTSPDGGAAAGSEA